MSWRDLPVTITPQWRDFFHSIAPGKWKYIKWQELDHVVLRGDDFRYLCKLAGISHGEPGPAREGNGWQPGDDP